jgi:hypothetical protein
MLRVVGSCSVDPVTGVRPPRLSARTLDRARTGAVPGYDRPRSPALHVTEVAAMHPDLVELGYHCRDFFLAHWDRYRDHARGELAHSTHLYGAGPYDPVHGERPRVRVTLATGIPEDVVARVNLGYLYPASVDVDAWRSDPDTLVVPDAGEVLYRLRPRHGHPRGWTTPASTGTAPLRAMARSSVPR